MAKGTCSRCRIRPQADEHNRYCTECRAVYRLEKAGLPAVAKLRERARLS